MGTRIPASCCYLDALPDRLDRVAVAGRSRLLGRWAAGRAAHSAPFPERHHDHGRLRRLLRRAGAAIPARARCALGCGVAGGARRGRHRACARPPGGIAARRAGRPPRCFRVYGLYMAPIVLSGQTTFAGYTLLGDTSVHFSLIDYISDHGARLVAQEPSSFSSVTDGQIKIGYPLGLHYELASVRWLLGAEVSGSTSRSWRPRSRSRCRRSRRSCATCGFPGRWPRWPRWSCWPHTCPTRTRSRAGSRSSG